MTRGPALHLTTNWNIWTPSLVRICSDALSLQLQVPVHAHRQLPQMSFYLMIKLWWLDHYATVTSLHVSALAFSTLTLQTWRRDKDLQWLNQSICMNGQGSAAALLPALHSCLKIFKIFSSLCIGSHQKLLWKQGKWQRSSALLFLFPSNTNCLTERCCSMATTPSRNGHKLMASASELLIHTVILRTSSNCPCLS